MLRFDFRYGLLDERRGLRVVLLEPAIRASHALAHIAEHPLGIATARGRQHDPHGIGTGIVLLSMHHGDVTGDLAQTRDAVGPPEGENVGIPPLEAAPDER
jgi:hypothetical protein